MIPPVPTGTSDPSDKKMRWFELCLVLVVAVGSSTFSSFLRARAELPEVGHYAAASWIWGCVRQVTALTLLFYVLRRRGLNYRALNLGWSLADVRNGVYLFVATRLAYFAESLLVHKVFITAFGSLGIVHGFLQVFGKFSPAAIPYLLLSPVFEELIVRAYLMNEVRELTGSAVVAVLASAILQASYHLYYGWVVGLSMLFIFLPFAVYYAIWKRALPTIVAHEVWDIFAGVHWYLR